MDARAQVDILVATGRDEAAWCEALRAELPQARVHASLGAPPCDYAVLWKPAAGLFERQRRLKAMFSLGAGVNSLLAMPELPGDVPLVRMEDAGMAAQMVEYALYVALREFRAMRAYAADQASMRWAPRPVEPRGDFRIGVLGLGVLGGAVARELAAFGFDVIGWSRTGAAPAGVRGVSGQAGLLETLSTSRLLFVFLPATPATTGLIGKAALAKLPRGAAIANLARGEVLDERALLSALDAGHVAAAYLDVFAEEPLPPGDPLWSHPCVSITPHVAALTDVRAACVQIASKIAAFEAGQSVTGVVDRTRGY